jgi:hypothetical protein
LLRLGAGDPDANELGNKLPLQQSMGGKINEPGDADFVFPLSNVDQRVRHSSKDGAAHLVDGRLQAYDGAALRLSCWLNAREVEQASANCVA